MRALASFAFTTFVLGTGAVPTASFRWQRAVAPPPGAFTQGACVVLDPEIFSHAEPGLRDLRLYQGGQEVPYAIEESFDRRALEQGATPSDDRSLYEVAAREPLVARPPGFSAAGPGVKGASEALQRSGNGTRGYSTTFGLAARIPVERIRLEPSPDAAATVRIIASPDGEPLQREQVEGNITPAQPALPVTLGANLQTGANVSVGVGHTDRIVRNVVLEMRRRSLCYQPHSPAPLTLFLGNDGIPAPQYDYARHFSTTTPWPQATLGPLLPNPDFHPAQPGGMLPSRTAQWRFALLLSIGFLLFSANRLLHAKKNPVH